MIMQSCGIYAGSGGLEVSLAGFRVITQADKLYQEGRNVGFMRGGREFGVADVPLPFTFNISPFTGFIKLLSSPLLFIFHGSLFTGFIRLLYSPSPFTIHFLPFTIRLEGDNTFLK